MSNALILNKFKSKKGLDIIYPNSVNIEILSLKFLRKSRVGVYRSLNYVYADFPS